MTLIQKFNSFFRKSVAQNQTLKKILLKQVNQKQIIIITLITLISVIFFSTQNIIEKRNINNKQNLKNVTKSKEFSGLTEFLMSKIKSPYRADTYLIEKMILLKKN